MSLKFCLSPSTIRCSLTAAVFLSIVLPLGMSGPAFAQQGEEKKARPKPAQPAPAKRQPLVAADKIVKKEEASGKKPLVRTYVGFALAEVDDAVREYLELPLGFGVLVAHVVEGGPAEKAGVQDKDIIMSFDGQRLTTPEHLQLLAATYSKGDTVELELLRKGAAKKVQVTLGEAQLPPLTAADGDEGADASGVMTFTSADSATPTAVQVLPDAKGNYLYAVPSADPAAVQKQVQEYREKMSEWMKQPAATRGPAPTLQLNMNPRQTEVRVHRVEKLENGEGTTEQTETSTHTESSTSHSNGGASIRVGGDSAGIRVNGGSSIVIGPGASIRTTGSNGGQVKIANAHGAVVVKQEDGKSVIEISEPGGKAIYKGPWQPGKEMSDKLPSEAQAVLKKMNLQQLELLNIHVGPGVNQLKEKGTDKKKGKDHKDADAGAGAKAGTNPASAANYHGLATEKAD
jgi:membrane-associated protease RseP (regulator of RpoE activity)